MEGLVEVGQSGKEVVKGKIRLGSAREETVSGASEKLSLRASLTKWHVSAGIHRHHPPSDAPTNPLATVTGSKSGLRLSGRRGAASKEPQHVGDVRSVGLI
jgi:hypothetical protein